MVEQRSHKSEDAGSIPAKATGQQKNRTGCHVPRLASLLCKQTEVSSILIRSTIKIIII